MVCTAQVWVLPAETDNQDVPVPIFLGVVRSVLVPALVFRIGSKIWWPSRLVHEDADARARSPEPAAAGGS